MFDWRKYTMSWAAHLANLWRRLRRAFVPSQRKRTRFERVIVLQSGEPTPMLSPAELVLIRSGARDKWLRFVCPNACGATIMLDLSPTRRPHWTADVRPNGTISVYPSVVNKQCGAHFIVRNSEIIWI